MDANNGWGDGMLDAIGAQLRAGIDMLPLVVGAVLILVLGWLLASLLRRASRRLARALNGLLGRLFRGSALHDLRVSPLIATIIGEILFWSVLLLAVTAASRVLGLGTVSMWLERIAVYLPNLIVAGAVAGVGYVLGLFVRQHLSADAARGDRVAELPGRIAQASIVAIALVIGLRQLGVRAELLVALVVVIAAIALGTVGLSIAWGARDYMRNVIALRSARAHLDRGLTVTIDGVTGTIVEIGDGFVTLDTDDGKVLVPGRLVGERTTTIRSAASQIDEEP